MIDLKNDVVEYEDNSRIYLAKNRELFYNLKYNSSGNWYELKHIKNWLMIFDENGKTHPSSGYNIVKVFDDSIYQNIEMIIRKIWYRLCEYI